jgi:hypothetical protein
MSVEPDLKIAITFLRVVRPRGPWTITALYPDDDGAPTRTFITESEVPAMREWIGEKNRRAGLYFCANPTRARMHKRPREEDIAAQQYVTLDFDPAKDETPKECRVRVRAKLEAYTLPPTLIWGTGNGVQAMWKLRKAVMITDKPTRQKCKLANLGLIQALRADSTQSLEHLFRIPGTVNFPNETKRKAGRKIVRAGNFVHRPERLYHLADFPEVTKKPTQSVCRGLEEPPGGWDTTAGINDAILYFQTTKDVAAEGRSGTAIRTARRARDYGVSEDMTYELMMDHWVPRCDYEWTEEELLGKVQRAFQNAENDPGCRTMEYRLLEAREEFGYD